jgi:hypothetical protein
MHKSKSPPLVRLLLAVLALLAFGATSLRADKVIVPSRDASGVKNVYPPYNDTFTGSDWFNSSGKCTPVDDNPNSLSRFLCLSGTSTGTIIVKPGLANAGHTYKVDLVGPITSTTTEDTCTEIAITGGTGTLNTNKTLCFGKNGINGSCVWTNVCYITNASTDVEITFTYSAYLIDGVTAQPPATSTRRWFSGAYRFTDIQDLCAVVAAPGQVYGPFAAGQTSVQVPGIATNATAVTVYADGAQIGRTTAITSPVTTVTVTPLVKGQKIVATQTVGGNESCKPSASTAGPMVGGGANPPIGIEVGLVLQQNANLGPANGFPVGSSTIVPVADGGLYRKPCTGATGYGGKPLGGIAITPSTCWQTITVNPADSAWGLVLNSGNGPISDPNQYAALCGLAFAIPDASDDTGPYVVYIDRIINGSTLIQNFEGYPNGQSAVLVNVPSAAGIIGNDTDNAPNVSQVSNAYASDGTNSEQFSFQFITPASTSWQRAVFNGSFQTNPVVDITQPITIDLLLLPVGQTAHNFGSLSGITNASPAWLSGTNTLGVSVGGAGPFTYEWSWSGGALANPINSRTYTIGDGPGGTGLSAADNGTYTVTVSDGTCTQTRSATVNVADPIPSITSQPTAKQILHVGANATFTVGASAPAPAGNPLTYQWQFNGVAIPDATDATFTTNNVQTADAGSYDVIVANAYLPAGITSSVAVLDVVQPGVVVGTGTGLRAEYYTLQTNGVNAFVGAPTVSRTNATINFDWLTGSPDPAISADYFTARWYGQVQALDTDTYTFTTRTDDGVRLWVNGQELVNSWIPQAPTEHTNTIALTANTKYPILMEYYEQTGGAVAQLSWSTAGGGVVKEIVPMSQLYPAASLPQPQMSFSVANSTNLVFNWPVGTYSLIWATNVTGPYTTVAYTGVGPYTYTNAFGPQPAKFFRLRSQ